MEILLEDIVRRLEHHFPLDLAESWDNPGLQTGSFKTPVRKVLLALDVTWPLIEYARKEQYDLVLTHHPLLFSNLKKLNFDLFPGNFIRALIQGGVSVYSLHTNLDKAPWGINQYLAEKLDLHQIELLTLEQTHPLYKITVLVPPDFEPAVRESMHQAGAGSLGNYTDCSFRLLGQGTFCPQAGSSPSVGEIGRREEVDEIRLEMLMTSAVTRNVVQAILKSHPYEVPAYDIIELKNKGETCSAGRIGFLSQPLDLKTFSLMIKEKLELPCIRVIGDLSRTVFKVGLVSGSGSSFLKQAVQQGCDVFVTGDVKYHDAQSAERLGIALIDAGHQGTEKFVTDLLLSVLNSEKKEHNWDIEVAQYQLPELIQTF